MLQQKQELGDKASGRTGCTQRRCHSLGTRQAGGLVAPNEYAIACLCGRFAAFMNTSGDMSSIGGPGAQLQQQQNCACGERAPGLLC